MTSIQAAQIAFSTGLAHLLVPTLGYGTRPHGMLDGPQVTCLRGGW